MDLKRLFVLLRPCVTQRDRSQLGVEQSSWVQPIGLAPVDHQRRTDGQSRQVTQSIRRLTHVIIAVNCQQLGLSMVSGSVPGRAHPLARTVQMDGAGPMSRMATL